MYGQHLVTTLVCFVKVERGKGVSVRGLLSGGSRLGGGLISYTHMQHYTAV